MVGARWGLVTDGGKDFQIQGEGAKGDFEPDLIVSGGGAAVGDGFGFDLGGDFGGFAGLEGTFGSDTERIEVSTEYIAGNEMAENFIKEHLGGRDSDVFDRAEVLAAVSDFLKFFRRKSSDVDSYGGDFITLRFEYGDAPTGIQSTGEREGDSGLAHLFAP